MPFCEADPWRLQYFADIACPEHVRIPTEDSDAWLWNPAHRWVYDKLRVAESQGLAAAPHGVVPPSFPVFSKPIVNLHGMGAGSCVVGDLAAYERFKTPGHFWMTLLSGEHVSSDAAVIDGEVVWWRHATGHALGDGTFDYWHIEAPPRPALEGYCGDWIAEHLRGYCGLLNLETIGGRIIEVHLRFADQWPDLYGPGWCEAAVRLYQHGDWRFADQQRRDGYSVVLFGRHGPRWRHPPAALVDAVKHQAGASSAQITFHEDRPLDRHAMPPGGFRLAILNGHELDRLKRGRHRLSDWFDAFAAGLPAVQDAR